MLPYHIVHVESEVIERFNLEGTFKNDLVPTPAMGVHLLLDQVAEKSIQLDFVRSQ